MKMDIMRHLADAIDALRKSGDCAADETTADLIEQAEFLAFRALDSFIKGQVTLDKDEVDLSEISE